MPGSIFDTLYPLPYYILERDNNQHIGSSNYGFVYLFFKRPQKHSVALLVSGRWSLHSDLTDERVYFYHMKVKVLELLIIKWS